VIHPDAWPSKEEVCPNAAGMAQKKQRRKLMQLVLVFKSSFLQIYSS
jgi:hypothetical protein